MTLPLSDFRFIENSCYFQPLDLEHVFRGAEGTRRRSGGPSRTSCGTTTRCGWASGPTRCWRTANPMKLVSRMKKKQEDLLTLKEQCHELLAAKQISLKKKKKRSLLQRMQASVGIPLTSDSDDPAFANFNQIVDEWAVQVRSRTGYKGV
ncbi:hypothetical protein FH972_025003 [Carpinus fangiana]|uniref:Protein FAM33A n=1 Tax=Carpinus fangiana TaxID=176857 RepID=A0A5N6L0B3_9ROSI|nr:hypothetical protein FH972_025003 [Carpinus fangiana]